MPHSLWAEFLETKEIQNAIPYLLKYDFGIAVAFPFQTMDQDHIELFTELHDRKIRTYVWLLLPDELGYWINEDNAEYFAERVEMIQERFLRHKLPFNLAVDMELPIKQMNLLEKGSFFRFVPSIIKNINRSGFKEAKEIFNRIAEKIRGAGGTTISPIPFNLTHELLSGKDLLQDAMQTPIASWDYISPMFYTSLFEKLTGGLFGKADARWYMYRALKKFSEFIKHRSGVSLGTIGPGKLGTEVSTGYDDPNRFAPDVEAALAAGIDNIFVFNLAGIMRSADPEKWFQTIRSTRPKIPKRTFKGDILYHFFSLLGKI